jgi:hypothetical protein
MVGTRWSRHGGGRYWCYVLAVRDIFQAYPPVCLSSDDGATITVTRVHRRADPDTRL